MVSIVAEHVQEKVFPSMDEKKLFVVRERDIIAELAGTDEIKKLRKLYRKENEMSYEGRDIFFFADLLSSVCSQNVYVGKEAAIYFEVLDTRDFLIEKYNGLPKIEAEKCKDEIKLYLDEADEELQLLRTLLLKYKS